MQFPHLHNAVSSLIACQDTIMCKGGKGLVRRVLHVSHYERGSWPKGSGVAKKPLVCGQESMIRPVAATDDGRCENFE